MPANPKGDKPTDVMLNLDTLEREGGIPEPFTFVLGGERFECADPADVDYRQFVDVAEDDVARQLEILLGGQYTRFAKHRLKIWKLQALMEALREHYQVGEDGASLL